MFVKIKNLQQQTVVIEIDETETVLALKEEIFKKLGGDYTVNKQKLIYAGAVMQDDQTLSKYNIDENKFIVVMIQRNTNEIEVTANTTNTQPQSQLQEIERPRPNTPIDNNNVPNLGNTNPSIGIQTASTSNLMGSMNSESNFLTGDDYNRAVETLMEMGYGRESIEHAMAASFNNPERAFEYLMDGIPDLPVDNVSTTNEGGVPAQSPEGGHDANAITGVLELLRQNPTLLRAALEQIGITQPALLEQITANPDAFFNLLNRAGAATNNENTVPQQPATSTEGVQAGEQISPERVSEHLQNLNDGEQRSGSEGVHNRTPDAALISEMLNNAPALTRADQDAIERLKALGFPEDSVLEAYIACDKNEQLAANLLLSNDDE